MLICRQGYKPVLSYQITLESAPNLLLSISVSPILRYQAFAIMALFLWLVASWSGAHGHLCFDGQEPPLSMHMDILGEHPEHLGTDKHVDADVDLGTFALAKLIKIDLPILIAATLLFVLLFNYFSYTVTQYSRPYSSRIIGIRPPLRAPPFFPA